MVALTAAVLLAHLVLLVTPLSAVNGDTVDAAQVRTLNTRSVEPVAAAAPNQGSPGPAVAASVKQRRTPSARAKAQPTPAAALAAAGAQPPLAAPEPSEPAPTDTPGQEPAAPEPAVPARPLREQDPAVKFYAVPGSTRLNYKVEANKFPYSLNSELSWQQQDGNYELRLEFSAFGQARVQSSRGQVTPEGLAPLRFSDKFRSEVAAHFDREKGKVTFSANSPDAPLLAGAQDRLSIFVQLAAMIGGDPARYLPATTIAIQTIGPRNADTWLFTVGALETLMLPGGEQLALKLVRNPRQEFDQKVELWLAPALGYLPARLRITEHNGDFIDQKWLATDPHS